MLCVHLNTVTSSAETQHHRLTVTGGWHLFTRQTQTKKKGKQQIFFFFSTKHINSSTSHRDAEQTLNIKKSTASNTSGKRSESGIERNSERCCRVKSTWCCHGNHIAVTMRNLETVRAEDRRAVHLYPFLRPITMKNASWLSKSNSDVIRL